MSKYHRANKNPDRIYSRLRL